MKCSRALWFSVAIVAMFSAGARAESRSLTHEAVIAAPVSEVWRAFTDEEVVTTWMTPLADIDLRVGGLMRTNYNPNGAIGDSTTIENRIISFEPERMLSLQNVRAPDGFPWAENFQQTWSVMYFTPLGPDRTRLRIVGMGYGEGPEWEQLYQFFESGNQMVIDELKKKFEAAPADIITDPNDVMARLTPLIGGDWIHESEQADGSVFRVRTTYKAGADGVSLVAIGWLGDAEGMFDHGSTIMYRDPHTGRARFLNVNERGAVAEGDVVIDHGSVVWDWNATELDGRRQRYRAETTYRESEPDTYRFRLAHHQPDGSLRPLIDIQFHRVQQAPVEFTRMKSQSKHH